jgi:hypothetical protein
LLLLAIPRDVLAQRIGLFFDEAGTQCAGSIAPFGPCVHVWVVGYPPPDSVLTGALFTVDLPPGIEVCTDPLGQPKVQFPRDLVFDVQGDVANLRDIDMRFNFCLTPAEPLVLAEFEVFDSNFMPRSDLRLHLVGTGVDSVSSMDPQFKTCDPENPEGFRTLVRAPSVDAVFNCTVRCYCTTAIVEGSWGAVKTIYRRP